MKSDVYTFRRIEMKYIMDEERTHALLARLSGRLIPDDYPHSDIANIYYDTPDDLLIRRSLDKPLYKEKLRLRTYGAPAADSRAFLEIKKKFQGIVYKRRIDLPCAYAEATMAENASLPGDDQISREIEAFRGTYGNLGPALVLSYERDSYRAADDPLFRVTFDRNIRYRTDRLSLLSGADGEPLLAPNTVLMEVKVGGALPISFARALSALSVRQVSFSKAGAAYMREMGKKTACGEAFSRQRLALA